MDKIMVKDRPTPQWDGPTEISPVYKFLKSFPETKGEIEWNYVKFLVSRDGTPLRRYGPGFDPASMERDVQYALEKKLPLPKKQQVRERVSRILWRPIWLLSCLVTSESAIIWHSDLANTL